MNSRTSDGRGHEIVSEIRATAGEAIAVAGDVTAPAEVDGVFAASRSSFGRATVLVHCAALKGAHAAITNISEEEWTAVAFTALDGAVLTSQAALADMVAEGYGRILFVGGPAAYLGTPVGSTHGATSKAGLVGLARGIAQEHGASGVRANVVSFAPFDDAGTSRSLSSTGMSMSRRSAARFLLDLCEDSFECLNGGQIYADGGLRAL